MKRQGLLDLNEAIQHPGTKLRFELTTNLPDEEDIDLIEPVTGTLDAVSTGNILLLKGAYQATCAIECARCGEPLNQKVVFYMNDEFVVEGVPAVYGTGEFAQVVEEDEYPLFHKNALIKDAYLRQGLIVNLPVQPLCEFGWDGPCPKAKRRTAGLEEHGHPALQKLRGLVESEED